METPRYLDLFVSESREHVSAINRQLLALESGAGGAAAIEEIFRAVHTLKGMAGAMGFQRTAALGHALEHLLEQLRSGGLQADTEVTDALFQAVDALEISIDREVAGEAGGGDAVLERLHDLGPGGEAAAAGAAAPDEPMVAGAGLDGPGRTLKVTLMINAAAPLPAVRAVLALRLARDLGTVGAVEPSEERLNAGDFTGKLEFLLRGDHEADEVRAALLSAGDVAHVLVEEVEEPGERGEAARGAGSAAGRGAVVRVNQERLDVLIDRVGELVVARDGLRRLSALREDEELLDAAEGISRLVAELRDEVMDLRLVPVGEVFDRFPRMVRDAARQLGKRVSFSMTGRHVELDRSLLNELADLLVHLIRNAVDHGLEPPEERIAAGKPETGEVRVSASRRGSLIVVRVEDDGRGIQRELVLDAATRLGLLTPEAAASIEDDELFAFLARPGFSTAARVTEVSGRGVGLDAVATRLRVLGGSMDVRAEAGRGSAFTLELPLSLAIVRSLHVEIAGEPYLIPIGAIREVAEVDETAMSEAGGVERLTIRDEDLPLLRLPPLLRPDRAAPTFGPQPVVVVLAGDSPLALMVDGLVGQHESVLKPFDPTAEMLPFFSGAALLADGRPCLVLDVHRIAAWAADHARRGETTTTAEPIC
jgi:two-component system chemotaxis sensor kinase CheA